MSEEFCVERVQTVDGVLWRVCDQNACAIHQQRWQAELMCLFRSVVPANTGAPLSDA